MRRFLVLVAALALAAPVVPAAARVNAPPHLASVHSDFNLAIHYEGLGLAKIRAHEKQDPKKWGVGDAMDNSRADLRHALISLDEAVKAGEIHAGDASLIEHDIRDALKDDDTVDAAAKTGNFKLAESALERALASKNKGLQVLTANISSTRIVKRCVVEKPFPVYAVPAGYSGSYNDVFPHGIPKGAKGVSVKFVDAATGDPVPKEVFPGQTWSLEVKGFQPDGKFDVRVNLTGTGFGKPDANSKNWKVVVSYDCP
jgi:hypothetical protein